MSSYAFLIFLAQGGCDAAAQQFDGAQVLRLRQFGHVHLEGDSWDPAQRLAVPENFFRHFFRVADQQRACRRARRRNVRA